MDSVLTVDGLPYRWWVRHRPTRSYRVLHVRPAEPPERSLRALFWDATDQDPHELPTERVTDCIRHARQHGWGRDVWLDPFEIPDAVRLPSSPPAELPAPTTSTEADRAYWRSQLGLHSVNVLVSPYPRWHTGRWALQLADPSKLDRLIDTLAFEALTPGQRFAGVEVAMATLDDLVEDVERPVRRIRALLLQEAWLHAYTVLQWTSEDEPWPSRPAVRLASELHEAIYDRGM